jgi:hypothetical protein
MLLILMLLLSLLLLWMLLLRNFMLAGDGDVVVEE